MFRRDVHVTFSAQQGLLFLSDDPQAETRGFAAFASGLRATARFHLSETHGAFWLSLLLGALLYLLTAAWPDTPDGLLHLHRVRALADALRAGSLYPRWFADFAFGYGYPVLHYYAPGFYYPPALLHALGVDLLLAVRVTLAASFALSAWWMLRLLRAYLSFWPALAGLLCFQFFPYRLYDLFVRGALPEFVAFMWLPLITLYTLRAILPGRDRSPTALACAALAWTALILTHNLTALMTALLLGAALPCAWLAVRTLPRVKAAVADHRRAQRTEPALSLHNGLAALLLGSLFSAWYAVPALLEARWVAIGHAPSARGYLDHFAPWSGIWDAGLVYHYPSAAEPMVKLPLYVAALLLAALLLAAPLLAKGQARGLRITILVTFVVTGAVLWLTLEPSAWLWNATDIILGKLQFPWRWQALAAFGIALLAALSLEALNALRLPAYSGRLAAILLSFYVVAYALVGLEYPPIDAANAEFSAPTMWAWDASNGQVGATWTGEFLPIWVGEQRWAIGRAPSDAIRPAAAVDFELVEPIETGYLSQRLHVRARESFTLIFHRFYFPAWRVRIDGEVVAAVPATDLGLLSVAVPAGDHRIEIEWGATAAVWIGRILTALSWGALLELLRRSTERRRRLPLWIALGALLALGAFGLTDRQQTLHPVGADFGAVQLAGAHAEPATAGDVAQIELLWAVQARTESLTAFVHVLDETGAIVAQQDAPAGGLYTPATRWTPGLLLPSSVEIPLPQTLPAGVYNLKAGLYRPGAADAPLLPAAATDPRVDIGVLRVRP